MVKRGDGREINQLRKINIERGFIKHAEGSCLISMGSTKVICTATVDKNVPVFLKNSGQGWLTAEYGMLPRSTHIRVVRERNNRMSGRSMEIQRLVGRALRSVVNLKSLGERTIWIDCDVIQADGGTRVSSIIGGFIALVDCLNWLYKKGDIKELYLTNLLGAISAGIWRGSRILDLTFKEDSDAEVDMNIVMKSSGEFIEIQGTAEHGSFSQEDLNSFLDLARKGINEIFDIERNLFKDIVSGL